MDMFHYNGKKFAFIHWFFIGFLITQKDESCKNKCDFVVNLFMIYVVISLTNYIASNGNGINE